MRTAWALTWNGIWALWTIIWDISQRILSSVREGTMIWLSAWFMHTARSLCWCCPTMRWCTERVRSLAGCRESGRSSLPICGWPMLTTWPIRVKSFCLWGRISENIRNLMRSGLWSGVFWRTRTTKNWTSWWRR